MNVLPTETIFIQKSASNLSSVTYKVLGTLNNRHYKTVRSYDNGKSFESLEVLKGIVAINKGIEDGSITLNN